MNGTAPLQKIKPRSARTARALKAREPQLHENPKNTLILQYTTCSSIVQLLLKDIYLLKRPLCQRFTKKNAIHPFEDPSSLEFFSEKNDAALLLFGSHSKKRPHTLTLVRCFEHKVLDMLELLVIPESLRTLDQFKNKRKAAVGLKPLISFCGTPFESPTPNEFTAAKSLLLDLFKGPDLEQIDVEGLQYIIVFSAADEIEGEPKPSIHMRTYLVKTRRSGQRLPRVELEEMGPRVDFRLGRCQQAEEQVMKEAMKIPRGLLPRSKKNVETDAMGDKIGTIHVGKQDLKTMQTRKMKGLKRSRKDGDLDEGAMVAESEVKRLKI